MPLLPKFLAVTFLAIVAAGAAEGQTFTPPPPPYGPVNKLDLSGTYTHEEHIVSTINVIDQKGGANDDTPPGQPVADTAVTAVDGQITNSTDTARRSFKRTMYDTIIQRNKGNLAKRLFPGYNQVFAGTGTGPNDRDGSIQGTAYLTYTVVSNATYDVDACLAFCDRVPECVFANLYYEYNNELLDFVFSEKSNLKCALYGDIHTAEEKLNKGGQQSEAPPAGLTYIQQSSGYSSKKLADPPTPEGYELVFGPTNGANNAPGYMGFAFIDRYDVQACADLCNTRGADRQGGACQYFNIWRALVDGVPTTYTCSMYYVVADASTAVNYGQGNLKVTYSRGYRRKNLVIDGGFEGYTCPDEGKICWTNSYENWIGTQQDTNSSAATIYHWEPYAHSGDTVALLGDLSERSEFPGTIRAAKPLETIAGRTYLISFFHYSQLEPSGEEAPAHVETLWNGKNIGTIRPGASPWTYWSFKATAMGNDALAFRGGGDGPAAFSVLDDITVFEI